MSRSFCRRPLAAHNARRSGIPEPVSYGTRLSLDRGKLWADASCARTGESWSRCTEACQLRQSNRRTPMPDADCAMTCSDSVTSKQNGESSQERTISEENV